MLKNLLNKIKYLVSHQETVENQQQPIRVYGETETRDVVRPFPPEVTESLTNIRRLGDVDFRMPSEDKSLEEVLAEIKNANIQVVDEDGSAILPDLEEIEELVRKLEIYKNPVIVLKF